MFDEDYGKRFSKPDIERIGIFCEMSYMHGVRYVPPSKYIERRKGATFLPTGRKTKTGTQSGYFDSEFKRLYEGEAISRQKKPEKMGRTPFLVGARAKLHSTPGDYYGSFNRFEAFSPIARPRTRSVGGNPGNFSSKGPKMGGPGYVDICLNKYPQHLPDRYGLKPSKTTIGQMIDGPFLSARYPKAYFTESPFKETDRVPPGPCYIKSDKTEKPRLGGVWIPMGPTKWQGGCHGGCFDKFPQYKPCKYVSSTDANKYRVTRSDPIFYPGYTEDKTMYTTSILGHNADLRVNTTNYKTVEPTYIKYLAITD